MVCGSGWKCSVSVCLCSGHSSAAEKSKLHHMGPHDVRLWLLMAFTCTSMMPGSPEPSPRFRTLQPPLWAHSKYHSLLSSPPCALGVSAVPR